MTFEIDSLRYIGIYEEPNLAAYGVDHSATPGDFLALPFKAKTLKYQGMRQMLDPTRGKMLLDGHDKKIPGARSCTVAVGVTLHSHGLDLAGNVASPTTSNWALLRLLKVLMGGLVSPGVESGVTQVQSGTTTTAITVTSGHADRFVRGGAIMCQCVAGSSVVEAREVLGVAGDVVTVKEAFSAIPITGTSVRGMLTVHLTENPTTYLQALIEGREATDGSVYCGLQGGFALEVPLGQLAEMTANLTGAYWRRLGTSSITIPSFTNATGIMALVKSELHVPTVGSSTLVSVHNPATTWEPQIAYAPIKSGKAAENVVAMRRQESRPVIKGSWIQPYEDDTWFTARDNASSHAVFHQLGALPGEVILLSAPTVQIVDVQPATAETELAGIQVMWEGRHDESLSTPTNDHERAAFRIHLG